MAEADRTRHLAEPGLWVQPLSDLDVFRGRPALFLDRDGTINIDTGYPSDPEEIVLLPGILPAIRAANAAGLASVIITNQSGVARGLFGWAEFEAVNRRVVELLSAEGCRIDLVLACAYHEDGKGNLAVADHPMRKPNPGMILRAAEIAGLDLARSIMVGDRESDIDAGRRAGLTNVFLLDGMPCEKLMAVIAAHSGGASGPSDLR
ncbi:D-glycero-alpha-D-manno-heptose-1,7-bisphosphate 7-phosphatase [Mesorhizobium australicum]|uniref:D,D-heptose 1,7-bisphosphate phosphatase n=1 Tax=Mesorhizobium australicum TaxID=536018 RepID=A0A1X7PKE8_9HYPH|nr:HAD family hydrolase [Mesorhizobium australicum]SMH51407.1 D-glycero-D-manno-heptose 1,7-bisphosphate phosphatase [Mesorhizobium australicum]